MHKTLVAALLAIAAVGCGGDTPETQIRDQATGYITDLRDGDIAGACERTVDPRDCVATMRAAELVAGGRDELIVAAGINDEALERAKEAKVTVDGDTGRIEGRRRDMEVQRLGDEWLLVLPELQ